MEYMQLAWHFAINQGNLDAVGERGCKKKDYLVRLTAELSANSDAVSRSIDANEMNGNSEISDAPGYTVRNLIASFCL